MASGHRGEWRSQLFGAAGCAGGGSNRAYVQYCFDLLHLDDRDLQSLPLRKAELAKLCFRRACCDIPSTWAVAGLEALSWQTEK
jgi:hypothetical protein